MLVEILKLGAVASRCYAYKVNTYRPLLALQYHHNYNHDQRRNYKNFGHKPDPIPKFTKYWHSCLIILFIIPWLDHKW